MLSRFKNYLFIVVLLISQIGFAQEKTISGVVTDNDDMPLPGVNITIENSSKGTQTDFDGEYEIEAEEGDVLKFSFVGFEGQKHSIDESETLNVKLKGGEKLEEIVVVGYGTQKAKDVSTSITSVKSEDFNPGVNAQAIEQIQGKVPGLRITTASGDPNANKAIRLRGQASLTGGQSPLLVLNGVQLPSASFLQYIPAEDIESYDVLKDQSATAIYGSRGANGVIMVETKKGGLDEKSRVNYSSKVGISSIAKKYDMLNAEEYKEASRNMGASEETIEQMDKGADTDWWDAITRTALTHSHNLSFTGGAEDFSYFGSVNYLEQEGIVVNTGKKQLGVNFYANKKALDNKLDITLGMINTNTNKELVDGGIFSTATYNKPTFPVFDEDGDYYEFSDNHQTNSLQHQKEKVDRVKESQNIIFGGLDYKLDDLLEGLSAGVFGSLLKRNTKRIRFTPRFPEENNVNYANQKDNNNEAKQGDIHINYSNRWDEHKVDVGLVHEYSDYSSYNFSATGRDYLIESTQPYDLAHGDSEKNEISSHKERYNLASFLARFSYNYASKYYVNLSYRRDGSSKFGRENRWGDFPAISLSWRLNEESFLRNVTWINDLKLRAGYGVTGNQDAISPYGTERLYSSTGTYYDAETEKYLEAYVPSQNENPDLKWEEVHGVNLGVNFILLDGVLSGDFDFYRNETKNLLYRYKVPVPPYFVDNILANVGTMVNKGFEGQISAKIIDNKDFKWKVNGQITVFDTEITGLSGTFQGNEISTDEVEAGALSGPGLASVDLSYMKEGRTPNVFRLARSRGIDADGKQWFSDLEGGEVQQGDLKSDMYEFRDPSPDFTYGFGSTISYKDVALSFFMRGNAGQKVFNNTRLIIDNLNRLPGNNTTRRAVEMGLNDTPVASDAWFEDASFLRMENISLSYSFRNIDFLEKFTISATANNLFVIHSYNGLDPEVRTTGSKAYIDNTYGSEGFYPKNRRFTLGLNVAF